MSSLPLEDDSPTVKIADAPIIADRSTTENYSTCPFMGRMRESRFKSVDKIALSGEECHKAISGAIVTWVDSKGALSRTELAEQIEFNIFNSRSDLVLDTHKAMKYSIRDLAAYIHGIHPSNILAFDGGEDCYWIDETVGEDGIPKRSRRSLSGQLDVDLQFGKETMRLTAELDLLHATRSDGLLRIMDWKTGFSRWSESLVESSYQFQFYSYLALSDFEDIECVEVVVWDTRTNAKTFPVKFTRKDMEPIKYTILGAAGDYFRFRNMDLAKVETRPSREGCRICSCAAECPACDRDIAELKADPEKAVDVMFSLSRKLEEYEKTLKTVVIEKGDIVTAASNAYGFNKPKANRKPTASLYAAKQSSSDSEEE